MDSSSNLFSATLETLNGTAVVVLLGELDLDTASELARTLDPLLDDGPGEVIVECSGLGFIDSSGIAVLVAAQNRLRGRGAHLTIRLPKPHALKVFATVGLIEFLNVETEHADPHISQN
jgi:anti-sigma B factor antagonist